MREPGFYWCKTNQTSDGVMGWSVARWDGDAWWQTGWDGALAEHEFFVPGPRISPPDLSLEVTGAGDKDRAVSALIELCHGGEFAAWMHGAGVELPFAANREYEEACVIVKELLAKMTGKS